MLVYRQRWRSVLPAWILWPGDCKLPPQAGELRLKHTAALAASLNPYGVLARGYAMVQDNRGRICTPDALRPGQTCKLRGTEYRVTCTVNTVEELDESTQKL